MYFRQVEDDTLAQYAYLIGCQQTGEALLIDPERDVDRYVRLAEAEDLTITAVAETHIHADFLSGAREMAKRHGVKLYLSDEGGADWSYEWVKGSAYDAVLLRDGDTFEVGNVRVKAVHTPGHTPEHLCYLITDAGGGAGAPMGIVTGDFVFVGDVGRPDLLETAAGHLDRMEPDARRLFHSVKDFLKFEDYLQVWPGHGAGSACGKALGSVPETTVGYERRFSPALAAAQEGEQAFVDYVLTGQPEPPLYFARMKRLNKEGPPLLARLPAPRELSATELSELYGRTDVTVIDTRADRTAFMRGHLKGALYAPLDKNFPTIAGSYAEPDLPLYLICERREVEEAVRCLVRIGLDGVAGYATPETLTAYGEAGGMLDSTEVIGFDAFEKRRNQEDAVVLDVRRADEYTNGHVPSALHIPHVRLAARMDEVPSGKTLLVHCATGIRSAAATARLERSGYRSVLVNDTFEHWADAYGHELRIEPAAETQPAKTSSK